MIKWGVNALNHGSSLSVFRHNELVAHYFDKTDELEPTTIKSALEYGVPIDIFWYERPWLKKLRQLRAGQYQTALDLSTIPRLYINKIGLPRCDMTYTPHHASHAAAGYYTCPFDDCAIVVLDAIGEFECATVWSGRDGKLRKLWHSDYPNSLGLFYSAYTKLLGFKPIAEEHQLQKLAEQGDLTRFYTKIKENFKYPMILKENMHRGVWWWDTDCIKDDERADIAAAVQKVFEEQVDYVMALAKRLTGSDNLIYMGGCAMNSRYNQRLPNQWKRIWSLPNPGDPSSSIGAVLYHTKRQTSIKDLGVVKHLEIIV